MTDLYGDPDAPAPPLPDAPFDGPAYDDARDRVRLAGQILRVYELMQDGRWRTLQAIADATGDPHASISAQLRHLRKGKFGAHTVERRHVGGGLFEYRMPEETK